MSRKHVVAAALGGIGTGFLLHAFLPFKEPVAEPLGLESERAPAEVPEKAEAELTATGERKPAAVVSGGAERVLLSEGSDVLITEALLDHTRNGVREGWGRIRTDKPGEDQVEAALDPFREQVLRIGFYLGVEMARQADAQEAAKADAERGGAMALLMRLDDEGGGPFPDVVRDKDTFNKFFPEVKPKGYLDGTLELGREQLAKRKPVPDGSVLTFPAGVFPLEDLGSYWMERFPRDLTIRGAGMGSTLLVLRSDLSSRSEISNFRIEDLTIHANNNYLFDVRGEAMLLTLESVRILGWTTGGGASCAFGSDMTMLRAIDCEFLGGYSRNSEHAGQMFDISTDGMLARFEGCLFSRVKTFDSVRGGATVVLDRCRVQDALGDSKPPGNFYLSNTPITVWNEGSGQPLRRDLNDLFPEWQAQLKN